MATINTDILNPEAHDKQPASELCIYKISEKHALMIDLFATSHNISLKARITQIKSLFLGFKA